ncbi:hypothetical protein [Streptococcus pacificus]|uniref:Cingulin n=1 Tax=Streptococcus pacificus TaxID=2740577 RepID=A0ABS0ZJE4_9STRE|nr:hypothetical protein [Streptococcus pacificus]MBJ8326122.1 hypothetical protein [Streptococcus pacificus]
MENLEKLKQEEKQVLAQMAENDDHQQSLKKIFASYETYDDMTYGLEQAVGEISYRSRYAHQLKDTAHFLRKQSRQTMDKLFNETIRLRRLGHQLELKQEELRYLTLKETNKLKEDNHEY